MNDRRVGWHVSPESLDIAVAEPLTSDSMAWADRGLDWACLAEAMDTAIDRHGPPTGIALSGDETYAYRSRTVLPLLPPGRLATVADTEELLVPLRAPLVEPDRVVVWAGGFRFEADGRTLGDRPTGVAASLLAADGLIVTHPRTWWRTVEQALRTHGLSPALVPAGLAAAMGGSDDSRRTLGLATIAVGPRRTEIGVHLGGRPIDIATVPCGRADLLGRIAAAFRAEPAEIERLFRDGASVSGPGSEALRLLQKGAAEPRPVAPEMIRRVAGGILEEFAEEIRRRLVRAAAWSELGSGVLLTGLPEWPGVEGPFRNAMPETTVERRDRSAHVVALGAAMFDLPPAPDPEPSEPAWRRVLSRLSGR